MTQAGEESPVLIVEDDAAVGTSLLEALREEGYAADWVTNGRDALAYLRARPAPRLILLDLMMPVMDGQEFRAEQLRDPALAGIPVVVLSGDGRAPEKASGLNADGFLRKPVTLETLLALVERYPVKARTG